MSETTPKNLDLFLMKWIGVAVATFGSGILLSVVAVLLSVEESGVSDGAVVATLAMMGAAIAGTGVYMVRSAARLSGGQRGLDGRCSHCNYDLRGHATISNCPECGHARP